MAGNGTPGSGGALRDEQGHPSMSRRLLAIWTTVLLWLVWQDVEHKAVPNQVWVAVVPIYLVLVGWAVGPRIFQYFGPKVAEVATAVGRARGTDNRYKDDER